MNGRLFQIFTSSLCVFALILFTYSNSWAAISLGGAKTLTFPPKFSYSFIQANVTVPPTSQDSAHFSIENIDQSKIGSVASFRVTPADTTITLSCITPASCGTTSFNTNKPFTYGCDYAPCSVKTTGNYAMIPYQANPTNFTVGASTNIPAKIPLGIYKGTGQLAFCDGIADMSCATPIITTFTVYQPILAATSIDKIQDLQFPSLVAPAIETRQNVEPTSMGAARFAITTDTASKKLLINGTTISTVTVLLYLNGESGSPYKIKVFPFKIGGCEGCTGVQGAVGIFTPPASGKLNIYIGALETIPPNLPGGTYKNATPVMVSLINN